ncbi:MAG TPA: DUF2867 domain-containing protein [Solirubrobacteraceae bacterium]|jgi:hypothetical protein|nr:DUF2867 domain-containing protein [Solirubrobacteraceae bacterium]
MKLPNTAHTSRPWRIHEIVPDFRLEDVWALPTPGAADEFPIFVEGFASADPAKTASHATRALLSLRWKLGALFGLDDQVTGIGSRVTTLRERLPDDLRATAGPEFEGLPFTSLYLTDNEFAAEIANQTMHGVLHFGWVPEPSGGYRGQMAIYVRPNGLLGNAYMAAIKPFRYLIVYPQMLQTMERRWRERPDRESPA